MSLKPITGEDKMFERDPTTAKIGEEILPFELGCLPEYFRKKAEVEVNYTQSVREKALREIKEAIKKSEILKDSRINDELILMFLTARKHDVDKTLLHLEKYVNFMKKKIAYKIPSNFEELSIFMTSGFVTVLPWRCQDGCTVFLMQLDTFKYEQHTVEGMNQFYPFLMLQCFREPMSQVNGFKLILVMDCKIESLRICSPKNVYLLLYGVMVILPGRCKGMHLIHVNAVGRTIWQIAKLFLPEKIKKRVYVHQIDDTLLDYFPRAILPTKYGGDLEDYDMTDWLGRMTTPEELLIMET